eukprot:g13802.t1
MSSTSDASDLVDSDESGGAEKPRKKRVLIRRSSTSTRSADGAKKRRLACSGNGEAAASPGRTKGKAKATCQWKPAERSRRSVRTNEPQSDKSSSSWHGSSDSDSGGGSGGSSRSSDDGRSDDDISQSKRTRNPRGTASARTTAPRTGRRRLGRVKPGGGSNPTVHRTTPSASERGGRRSAQSTSRQPDSASSHVGTESDEDEAEFELLSRPRRPKHAAAALGTPGEGATAKRSGVTTEVSRSTRWNSPGSAASAARRADSRGDDDSDFLISSPRAARETANEPAGSGDSTKRGSGRGSGGGSGGARSATVDVPSNDDANDCLRNTDSDDDGPGVSGKRRGGDKRRGGSGGSGGGSGSAPPAMIDLLSEDDANDDCLRNTDSEDSSAPTDDGDGPVLCRCGERDWQDGTRWIQCDARGCRTWEHLRCAYPVEDNPEGESASPPEVHLCKGCSAKGSSAAAGKARRGGRRCLTRCGDGAASSPTKRSSDDGTRGLDDGGGAGAGAGTSRVRRSQRVSAKENRRVPLKKNVVGDELSSSSSDEVILDPSGSRNDDRDLGEGSEEDDFWAPEGKVETSQEYRCHCGVTLRDGDANGGDDEGGTASGQWVQCHSDHCRVWEHAACCERGCSPAQASAQASAANIERRHWCRACDPRGRKHAKWEEKTRKRLKRERDAKAKGRSAARSTSTMAVRMEGARGREMDQVDARAAALLGDIWSAVISGNASLVEELFREADGGSERSGVPVERLLATGQPPPIDCLDFRSRLSGGGDGDTEVTVANPLPPGLSLLMLAAGYWINVADASAASAAPAAPAASAGTVAIAAAAPAPPNPHAHTDCAPESNPIEMGVRSVDPESSPSMRSTVDCNPDTAMPGSPSTAANAADAKMGTEAIPQNEGSTEGGSHADPAGAAAPPASAVSLAVAGGGTGLPQLGSEARLAVLRMVLERIGARAVLAADGEGKTAVHHAAAVNGAAEAALLLGGELGGEAALAKSHEGLTPLQVSAAAGHAEACTALLRALPATGTRAAVLTAATDGEEASSGETALHLACLEGHAGCVRAILDEDAKLEKELADEVTGHVVHGIPAGMPPAHHPLVLVRAAEGETPLMAAAGCPSPSCVELVVQNLRQRVFAHLGAELAELRAVNHSGMNALHYAAGQAKEGSVEAAKAVLDAERSIASGQAPVHPWWDDPAAMINSGDADNEASPLHLAAAISHKEMVTLLLTEGANPVLEDRQGWTPVMYADFDGRKEGAVLELLHHEPERQLEALGRVLSSREGRNQSRIVEVVRNLVTVPSFFSLVNGFIRKRPDSLLGSLSFLKNEPGLLDFENKRNLMRTLLSNPDEATRNALNLVASPPMGGFGYSYDHQIYIRRGPGRALSALLGWMESAVRRWGESGLAAWLRGNNRPPSFIFEGEAGYGQGVDREGWEMIAGDIVLPSPPPPLHPATVARGAPVAGPTATPAAASPTGNGEITEAYFVQVDEGMSSYCPRDLRGGGEEPAAAGDAGVGRGSSGNGGNGGGAGDGGDAAVKAMRGRVEREKDLQAFELLGMVIGATICWNKVLNLNLNPVVWKTILSRKVTLSDLDLVDTTYYKSLMQVQDMDGVDQLGLSFAHLDLKFCADVGDIHPDDEVTDENKALYASLALESRTFGRWRKQARALSRGLRRLVPLALLKMFTESELGLLLAGPGDIDPVDWERHTHFDGDATLKGWFWSVVRSLSKEERSLLLQFATGCSRLPAGGFEGLAREFKVVVIVYDFERPLPRAATCFYMLKLPNYPDLYSLRKYLLVAIRFGTTGFEFS